MRQQQRDGDWTGRDGRRSERRSERDGRRHCTAQNNNTLCFVFDVFVLLFFPLLLLLFCFDKEKGRRRSKKIHVHGSPPPPPPPIYIIGYFRPCTHTHRYITVRVRRVLLLLLRCLYVGQEESKKKTKSQEPKAPQKLPKSQPSDLHWA